MDMMSIRSMFNSRLSCQSGGGVERGPLPFHFRSMPKCYPKMIFGVFTVSVTNNIPVICSRFPSPTVCSIHSLSSSSHHQARFSKSPHCYHSQFYPEELGSKKAQDKNFLPNHQSETLQEQGEGDQVLHHNFSTQPNDILDESNKVYDFLGKPQLQNGSNTDNLGLQMDGRDRNRGPTAEDGGKEDEGKPISKAENLLMSSSRIQTEEEAERLRSEMGRRDTNRPRRQMMKRSTMIAKQVISIQSALTLGFVSQLWVDTTSVRS